MAWVANIIERFIYCGSYSATLPRTVHTPTAAEAIRQKGYEVHTQVGCSGYRLDLALPHPDALGIYMLGVECDGATYHRSATARDRDQLRQSVLEGLGWRIHRIWSPDWLQNPEKEIGPEASM